MKKQLLFLVMMLSMAANAFAVEAEIDGLWYEVITKGNVAKVIQFKNNIKYQGDIVIPETVNYEDVVYSVTSIGESAFSNCSDLTSVTIPCSVTSIGSFAFSDCNVLTSVHITDLEAWCKISFGDNSSNPLSYTHHLFLNGEEVKDLVVPNSVTNIRNYAFYGFRSLTSVTIPNSVTSIGDYAFSGCKGMTSVTIPNSVTNIESYAFSGCIGLTTITIPNGVTSIGERAFVGCSGLVSVTIGNSVTTIGNYAFRSCSALTSITIGNSVTSIGSFAFRGCTSLVSLTIPNSVISIGNSTFRDCSALTTIRIGNGVKKITSQAFTNCPELTDVYCHAENVPSTDIGAFSDSYIEFATLHVPTASIDAYKEKEPWKNFKKILGMSKGDGTLDNPFSPSEASAYVQSLEAGVPSDKDFYIYGKISSIRNEFTTTYGNATFYISENGGTNEPQFLIYRTLYLGNKEFLQGDENIKVGDDVIICGKVINYNGTTPETYEKASYIYSLNGNLPKCATPIITLEGKKLKFSCDTEGVTFHYDITVKGSVSGTGDEMEIPNYISYPVTVFASKAGYQNSDVAYMDLPRYVGKKGDANSDGEVDIADAVHIVNYVVGKIEQLAPQKDMDQTDPE